MQYDNEMLMIIQEYRPSIQGPYCASENVLKSMQGRIVLKLKSFNSIKLIFAQGQGQRSSVCEKADRSFI